MRFPIGCSPSGRRSLAKDSRPTEACQGRCRRRRSGRPVRRWSSTMPIGWPTTSTRTCARRGATGPSR
ncbi:hypothetical protein ACFPRL_22610 [Pseudoclavibacter helvolus]